MVNFSVGAGSLLGLLDIALAIAYLVLSIALISRGRDIGDIGITLYVIQAVIAPILLLSCGFILFLHGWRLDPILLFAYVQLHILLVYLGVKDFILFSMVPRRNRR